MHMIGLHQYENSTDRSTGINELCHSRMHSLPVRQSAGAWLFTQQLIERAAEVRSEVLVLVLKNYCQASLQTTAVCLSHLWIMRQ